MLTNTRSLQLLGNNQARSTKQLILNTQVVLTKKQSFESSVYDDFAKIYSNYDEGVRTILNSSENINGESGFQMVIQ